MTTTVTDVRPTRRSVTRAAAWSVPVIAVATAAPAYAASPCDPRKDQVLKWSAATTTVVRTPNNNGLVADFDPDGASGPIPALTLTMSATFVGNMAPGLEPGVQNANGDGQQLNYTITSNVGGLGTSVSALCMQQATSSTEPQGAGDRGSYTFTFSQPVSNLRFTLTDIDSSSNDFWDAIALVPAPTSAVPANSNYLVTSTTDSRGVTVSPAFWRPSNNNTGLDNVTRNDGNLVVTYAGPISSFRIAYFNNQTSFSSTIDTDQVVYITDMTVDYKPC